MRKPAAFPLYPYSPTVNRCILIRPLYFSIGHYLQGSRRIGGLMCVGLSSATDSTPPKILVIYTGYNVQSEWGVLIFRSFLGRNLTSRLRFGYQRYNQMPMLYQCFLEIKCSIGWLTFEKYLRL